MFKNKKVLKYVVICLVIVMLVIGGIVLTKKDEENGKTIETMENKVGLEVNYDIVVEIKGEVKHPGIYTLPKDTRIQDLINVAGGLTIYADCSTVNLASKLSDGMVVTIPTKNNELSVSTQGKVNINTGSISELMTLSGIGESLAKRIIDYRNANGNFKSIEEIKNVSGIGDALFNKIKDDITI
ncbi:MAG: helix-hairpin-helix domain-containing protein [Bacilli bacterium]|nr:helix-hairpin-helix domain-containing protein [Bacilli bacterium]